MTKKYFNKLAEYNIWANDRVCDWLSQISDEQWDRQIESSFKSIRETVLHIMSAEKIWLERLKGSENPVFLSSFYKGNKSGHIELWKQISKDLKILLDGLEENMDQPFSFKKSNGDKYTMYYYEMFSHVFNHSTFHRGQLVTMLRQTGFANLQSTDLMIFFRK